MFFNRIRFKHNNQIVSSASSLASSSVGIAVVDEVTGTVWEKTTKGTFVKQKSSGIPAGTVIHFAGSTVPDGFLELNGAELSRTVYADLFAVVGTVGGIGNGSTTFNLCDARGEFIRGIDNGRGVDAGRTIGSYQADAFQGHHHNMYVRSSSSATYGTNQPVYIPMSPPSNSVTDAISDGINGTPRKASETRPRNIAFMTCIKY